MAEKLGTGEFETGELEGLAQYLKQRARSVKKQHKQELLINYVHIVENAADRICRLERRVRSKK